MQITFWGAAREVTGSMHLLEVAGERVLLDCGMYQGRRSFERNSELPFEADSIDAVVLSHAHIDHCGNLPVLVREGFRGDIWCTAATRDLCAYMLLDSAKIQESEAERANRWRIPEGKRPWEPLYTRRETLDALMRFRTVSYEQSFEPVEGLRVHFRDAGHILGAAIVVCDLEEGSKRRRLLFSGDVGREGLAILRDPRTAPEVEILVMESTYGDREHEPYGDAEKLLRTLSTQAYRDGGKMLIPAFALGRTQEIVYRFNLLWEEGELTPIDVFVDSPLGVHVTDVYRLHPECYDEEMREALLEESDQDPLGFRHLRYVRSVEGSKKLNHMGGPAVIVSASGMCEGGRILHHLRNHIEEPSTMILFSGYQAEGTLGREILGGAETIEVYGRQLTVRARIESFDSYSAHADRTELLDWAGRVQAEGSLEKTFLVHGEESSALALAESLRDRGIGGEVEVPERGRTFSLD